MAVAMAETRTLQHQLDSSQNLSIFTTLDPASLILSQYASNSNMPNTLQLTTDSYFMERGPRYNAYAKLRESNLRRKRVLHEQKTVEEDDLSEIPKSESTPPNKKSVKFERNFSVSKRSGSSTSVLAQSVPDFSSAIKKENRRPPPVNRVEVSATPPPASKSGNMYGSAAKLGGGGSRSVNSGEKRNGGLLMARKSYASIEDLKGLSAVTATAIGGENRGGRSRMVTRKSTVLGYRYN